MAYIAKTNWQNNEIVEASDINRIEQGVKDAHEDIKNVPEIIDDKIIEHNTNIVDGERHGIRVNDLTNKFEYFNGKQWVGIEINEDTIRDNGNSNLKMRVATSPPPAIDGRLYYNSDDKLFYVARNGQWWRLYVGGDEKLEQNAPATAPTLESRTDTSIKLVSESDKEYMYTGGDWQESSLFTGLNRNTEYTFYSRFKETDIYKSSPPSPSVKFTTDKGTQVAPSAPTVSNIEFDKATVNGGSGTEVRIGSGDWYDSPHTFISLTEETTYNAYARRKETITHYASPISSAKSFKTEAEIKIYGIEIDETNSNPETAVTYTDDAIGFTSMKGNNGSFQWGSWQTIFNEIGIKPCVLKDGVVQYYLNPNDYTKKADGTASDITSGTAGDVMIEFPKIYWKINRTANKLYVKYSTKQFTGAINPAHKVGGIEKDKIYLSAYMGNEISGKLRSLSGKAPTVSKTIGQFRTIAQANGAGYQQTTYYALLMLQVLYLVWFKNLNSQTALGRGYVDGNSASINTGGANTKGMFYGETSGKQQNKFCGIEDFWGNVYYWIDGLYSDSNRNIMISKQNVFNDNGTGYSNHGVGASANISGYINKVQGGNETGFIIKEKDGSSSTYFADAGNLGAEGLPLFGGYWYDGDNAGAFQLHVSTSASTSASSIGARSCFIGS